MQTEYNFAENTVGRRPYRLTAAQLLSTSTKQRQMFHTLLYTPLMNFTQRGRHFYYMASRCDVLLCPARTVVHLNPQPFQELRVWDELFIRVLPGMSIVGTKPRIVHVLDFMISIGL